ncbi:MAG: hypothetical protein AB8B58_05905 [Roseobacter sp.]
MAKRFNQLVEKSDSVGKLGGAIIVFAALVAAIPIIDGYLKAATGIMYGVKGAVYYEVGADGDAMFASTYENDAGKIVKRVDGGLYLLRNGDRNFSDVRTGDVLQAGTDKRFKSRDGDPQTTSSNPDIFILRPGECVVVLSRRFEVNPEQAYSAGWLNVATTSCGLFS